MFCDEFWLVVLIILLMFPICCCLFLLFAIVTLLLFTWLRLVCLFDGGSFVFVLVCGAV